MKNINFTNKTKSSSFRVFLSKWMILFVFFLSVWGAQAKPSFENEKGSRLIEKELRADELQAAGKATKTIRGTVRESSGEPIPFVSVVIKGTAQGTVTDMNGEYQLAVSGDVNLVFGSLGFKDFETHTKDKQLIDVVLIADNISLDEVVVMGYNEVERNHLSSSVASIDMKTVKNRPMDKLAEGFSGTIPGVTMMQSSNLPGSSPGPIRIRGVSTLQKADPLVIVDGMEQSMNDIDPNQVKSISVLKDAAAASMYGSRGANGVIIIETERGTTGDFRVNLHTWASIQSPIDLPDFVNSADYMMLNNEARGHQGQSLLYTEQEIQDARDGLSPNVDWMDLVMEQQPYSYNASANVSGGGGVGTFNLMMGYNESHGLNIQEGTNKFTARFNTNINIADRLILLADFYAHQLQVDRLYANSDGHGLYAQTWRMNPTQEPFYPNSDLPNHYILHADENPLARIYEGGARKNMYDRSTINLRPRYYINDNLHIAGNVSYMINKSANKHQRATFKFFDANGAPAAVWKNEVGAEQGVSESQITARALLNYKADIRGGKDVIYAVGGTEVMNHIYTDFKEISKSSFFAKLNYSLDERYLFEFTGRADGSSKFAPGHQWGFFPSGSLGWNVHNEGFMRGIKQSGAINALKFRASYGEIGNENVDPYLWQEIVNKYGWMIRVPNPEFSWEKQKQFNIGVDVSMLKKRLNLTADVYDKFSYDLIFSKFPVPPLTGSSSLESTVNIGEVSNKGWEVSVNWSDKIGDLSYSVGAMLFDNVNKVMKAGYFSTDTLVFAENTEKIWYKGIAVENFYGYESDGYFQDQDEIDNADATLPNTRPGDIRYVDQNGDGIINDADRVNLGDPFPHFNYSVTLDLKYKRWDFYMLGQGVGKRTGRLDGMEGFPVFVDGKGNNLGTPRKYFMENRWTPETPNSRFPRMWSGETTPNSELSDVWLGDASFFRFKTLQLGYNIPKIGNQISSLRLYVSAQDAITLTNWEGLDPERDGGNGRYPRMATYSIGLKVTLF